MERKRWTRRQVIGSLAIMPLAANTTISFASDLFLLKPKVARCKLLNSEGEPYDSQKMTRFHICDLNLRPFQIDPQFSPGEILFLPAEQPFRISLPVEIPGFGEVFCYADNRGAGFTAKFLESKDVIFLNYEFAADRLATVRRIMEECRQSNINLTPEITNRVTSAEKFFTQCNAAKADDKTATKWAMESLRESLWAGEMIVIERARQNIAKNGARKGFMFGCNAFRFRDYGNPYTKYFESLFNFATLPFYHSSTERVQGKPDYSRIDQSLAALQNTQIISKGHPLIFYTPSVTPDWVKNKTYSELKQISLKYIEESVLRFRGRIHIWDIINEGHVQPDIKFGETLFKGYTKENAIDLSCAAAKKAREADPTCFRVVNNTGTWCDYYMGRQPSPWQQNVYDYLKALEDAKCEYEAIGLQYYHSGRDLLEFERNLEVYKNFGKRIHITEVQIPSSSAEIARAEWWGGGVGGSHFPWHGKEFTETIQADWVESVYTMLYSKTYVDAITWWDMTDPGFVPHGGFFNQDMSPKESYSRLKSLLDKWKNAS
jgi:endo-1,4-beta-xylanase